MRHFERDGRRWSIHRELMRVRIESGAVGRSHTIERKAFAAPSKARAFVDKAIARKLAQGWVEVAEAAEPLEVDLTPGVELRRGQHVIAWRRAPARVQVASRSQLERALQRHPVPARTSQVAGLEEALAAALSGEAHPVAPEVATILWHRPELVDLQVQDEGLARTVVAWVRGLRLTAADGQLWQRRAHLQGVRPQRRGPWSRLRERARRASAEEHAEAVAAIHRLQDEDHPILGPLEVHQRAAAAFVLPTARLGEDIPVEALRDDVPGARASGLLLLACLGEPDALLDLLDTVRWTGATDRPLAWCVPTLLDRLGPEALPVLARMHELDPSPSMLRAIGQIKSIEAAAYLAGKLSGREAGVVEEVLRASPSFAIAGLLQRQTRSGSRALALLEELTELHQASLGALAEQLPDEASGRLARFQSGGEQLEDWDPGGLQVRRDDAPLPVWLRVPRLASVTHADGRPLSAEATHALLRGLVVGDGLQAARLVARLEGASEVSIGRLAVSLIEAWEHAGLPADETWILACFPALADDEAARWLGRAVLRWAREHYEVAKRAVDALAAIRGESGQLVLHDLSRRASPTLRRRAEQYLQPAGGLPTHEATLLSLPTLGLDARGRRSVALGDRTLQVRVDEHLHLELSVDGRTLRSFPRRRKVDDPTAHETARAVVSGLRKDLRPLSGQAISTLEQAMVARDSWRPQTLQRLVEHPLLSGLVRSLVWADDTGAFRLDEGGEPVDVDSEPWPVGAEVRLVHPSDLSVRERAAWRENLADYEVKQPFAQLGRHVHGPEVLERVEQISVGRVLSLVRPGGGWTAVRDEHGAFELVQGRFGGVHVAFGLGELYVPGQVVKDQVVSLLGPGWAREPIRDLRMSSRSWDKVDPLVVTEVARALGV